MAPRDRKRLDRLDISKVSGVDHPAHLVEGYAVLKAAAGGDEQALAVLAAADDIASSFDELADALTKAEIVSQLTGEQQAAASELIATVVSAVEKAAGDDADVEKAGRKISSARLQKLKDAHQTIGAVIAENDPEGKGMPEDEKDALAKAQARIVELEAEVAKAVEKAKPAEPADEASELAKAWDTLPEPVRKAIEADRETVRKASERAEEAEKVAKAERDNRIDAEYLAKARQLELPEPSKVAKALRLADEAGPEVAEFVKSLLIQRGELEQNARVLKVLGADGERDDVDPQGELNRMAEERSNETGESIEKASAFIQDTPKGRELRKAISKARDRKAS